MLIIILVSAALANITLYYEAATAQNTCGSGGQNGYTVTVCIVSPLDSASVSGVVSVEATTTLTDNSPGVQKLTFNLNGEYLITDFAEPYAFKLPTEHFVDGAQQLSVQADMRDDFLTDSLVSITLNFNNGVTTPPVNSREFTPYVPEVAPGMPLIVVAVGDGAGGRTKKVTDLIASLNPDMFLYLGDVYENGSYTEFYNWYGVDGAYFSQFRSITNPTIGNHEYELGVAPGYYDYWDNVPDYYSFDAGGWHFISLNSTNQFNQRRPGTRQFNWLQQDRSVRRGSCSLAYWHHPRFSVGEQDDTLALDNFWRLLAATGVDVVLTAHDHNYQRWLPLDARGRVSEQGIVQFVAGMGGHGISSFGREDDRMAVGFDSGPDVYGVLRLEMYPDRLKFEYINIDGNVLDSGEIVCYGNPS